MTRYPQPKPWMLVLGASLVLCAGSAAAKTPVRKELEALNQQVAALSAQLAATNATLATISEQIAGLGGAPKPLHAVQLCVEAAVAIETKLGARAEGEAAGEGSVGVDAYGNGASVEAKARGKAETGVEVKGTFAGPKAVYCFDILEAATRILASRSREGGGVARGASAPRFDPTRLAPAVQEYVLSLAELDPVNLADRVGAVAQFVSLEPGALATSLDALAGASGDLDPVAIMNGEGPLKDLAASLPLPPAVRASIDDPGQLMDRLNDFRPCELSGLKPNLQGILDNACELRPSWDPAAAVARFGELGDLIANVQSVLTRSVAIQNVVNAIRTLLGRVCRAVDAIPGVNPNCSV
jgi:hypothetical protein